ncbi:hypothetical protein N9301_04160 [Paracoccaceae bacterium]|nr:hypothetical protein [Paracoccaceae bacterium]
MKLPSTSADLIMAASIFIGLFAMLPTIEVVTSLTSDDPDHSVRVYNSGAYFHAGVLLALAVITYGVGRIIHVLEQHAE